jgi:hypothetical protein
LIQTASRENKFDAVRPAAFDRESESPTSETPRPSTDTAPEESARALPDAPADPLLNVEKTLAVAEQFNQRVPDYVCRLTRTERVRGSMRDPELILMKLRGNPRSVYFDWLDHANAGRSCIWVEGHNRGKMISRGGRGDLLLAGKTLQLDPNGTLARSKSCQPITESGLDKTCAKIRRRLELLERGDTSQGTLSWSRGPDPHRPLFTYEWILHEAPPGVDEDLPDGGEHRYGFRTDDGRLEIVYAFNPQGQMMYSFRFDRFIPMPGASDSDFDPQVVWAKNPAGRAIPEEERMVREPDDPVR